jgi:conjugal transfer mating pair stabilization protein TraG
MGAGLHGASGGFGGTRDQVLGAGLHDPRAQVAGLDGRLAENFLGNAALGGGDAVDRFHQDAQGQLSQSQARREAMLAEQRSDYWERQLLTEANSHRSPAEATADQLAGGIGHLLQRGIIQGDRAVAAFNGLLSGLQDGEGWSDAVAQAREQYGNAIDGLASYQLQSLPENALTATQEAFYRDQVDNGVLGNSALGQAVRFDAPEQQAPRERLVAEHGPDLGPAIAHQLSQAASSLDNSPLTEVIAYNRAEADAAQAQKTESRASGGLPGMAPAGLIHPDVSGGPAGAVLDLIADPESRGNYNALFGDAGQQQLRLTDMTLEQVQQVQQQLVAERGGSPVGRYQIIDDTLGGLIERMGLSGQERFSPALQDRMALVLAGDAGLSAWQSGRMSDETFAGRLATIWAGLPKDATNRSHYEGQAGNRAQVGWTSVVQNLGAARRPHD